MITLVQTMLSLSFIFIFIFAVFILSKGYITRGDVLHPLIILSAIFSFFFIIPGTYILFTENFVYADSASGGLAQSLILVVICFLIVCFSYHKSPKITISSNISQHLNTISSHQLLFIGSILTVFGLIPYVYYVLINGGFTRLLTIDARLQFQTIANTARFRIVSWGLVFGGYTLAIAGAQLRKSSDSRKVRILIYILSAIVILYSASFRERFIIGFGIACVIIYIHRNVQQLDGGNIAIVGMVGVLSVVLIPTLENSVLLDMTVLSELIYRYRLEALMQVLYQFPDKLNYYWGQTFTTIVWFKYPGKSKTVGNILELIVMGVDREGYAVSGTAIAELYINYSYAGPILFSGFFGILLKQVISIRDSQGLLSGFYPPLLYAMLVAVPTGITWSLRVFVLTIGPVVVLSLVFLYAVNRAHNV